MHAQCIRLLSAVISSSDDYLQMSPNGDFAIFSPTRLKDSPKAIENSHDADKPPQISITSFTFPDTAAEQHSPTLSNHADSPVSKSSRSRKDGMEPLPEEIPMLPSTNSDSPQQPRKFAQTLQQSRATPTPSPRHTVNETKLISENDNYVNVKSPKHVLNNNGSKAPEAFSNPSYLMLKTVNEQNADSK